MSMERYENGVLAERWDDATRTYTDYRTEPDTVRAYTTQENAVADAAAAQATQEVEHAATIDRMKLIISELQTEKARVQPAIDATNATINANPAPYIRDNARAIKRVADAVADLVRYLDGK